MIRELAGGAAKGAVATIVMSVPMVVTGEEPPKPVTLGLLARLGLVPDEEGERNLVSVAGHLAFGAGMGAVYSALRARLPTPGPPVLHGIGYGLAVYTASYAGWIPALGLLPEPDDDRPRRQSVLIVGHVIYGALLGGLERP